MLPGIAVAKVTTRASAREHPESDDFLSEPHARSSFAAANDERGTAFTSGCSNDASIVLLAVDASLLLVLPLGPATRRSGGAVIDSAGAAVAAVDASATVKAALAAIEASATVEAPAAIEARAPVNAMLGRLMVEGGVGLSVHQGGRDREGRRQDDCGEFHFADLLGGGFFVGAAAFRVTALNARE